MQPQEDAKEEPGLVAVIELGTTSVRMVIAQGDRTGGFETLESLQHPVSLGKDTLTKGYIGREATEQCVRTLRSFRRILDEYRVTKDEQIVAVATSAVREAGNRDAFLDRIYIATGLIVSVIDEAEVNRFTYLAVQPLFAKGSELRKSNTLVVEVGGGSTEALMFQRGKVRNAHGYRLGSLRLRELIEQQRVAVSSLREFMRNYVDMTVARIQQGAVYKNISNMIALGGDARFAAAEICPKWQQGDLARVPVAALAKLTDRLMTLSVDELVKLHHISYPDAETLAPALLVYARLAEAFELSHILVGSATLRDGLLAEMNIVGVWPAEFRRQIVNSAIEVGKKYRFDRKHAEAVAALSARLFHLLQDEHQLDERYELILRIAALLHNIGLFVSNRNHHKHSRYLILNSDLFGLGAKDTRLTALVARYHRRSLPKPLHEGYVALSREERVVVQKLASILRIADALHHGHGYRLKDFKVTFEPGKMIITLPGTGNLAMAQHSLREKGDMFEMVYGMTVLLRGAGGGKNNAGS